MLCKHNPYSNKVTIRPVLAGIVPVSSCCPGVPIFSRFQEIVPVYRSQGLACNLLVCTATKTGIH
jgi:hypothetical protein